MVEKISTKLSDESRKFLGKFIINLVKSDKIDDMISYDDALRRIVKFFKLNHDAYIELISMEVVTQ